MQGLRWTVTALVVVTVVMSSGCLHDLEDPSKSFSSIPTVIMDFELERNLTKIWVMSVLSHIRYENVSLIISPEGGVPVGLGDNYTYCVTGFTDAGRFEVEVRASTEDRDFELSFSVEVSDPDSHSFYTITIPPDPDQPLDEPEEVEVAREDLPWKKTLRELTD